MMKAARTFILILLCPAAVYLTLIGIACIPYETTPVDELTGPRDLFVAIRGDRIHYIKQGQGPPVILVHGFACSTFTWRALIPLLSPNYTVYAVDLLGFGLSDKPPDADYSFGAQAKRIISFMEAVRVPSAYLVGHSMGGAVAACTAAAAPSKINKLVIIAGAVFHGTPPAVLQHLFFPLDKLTARVLYARPYKRKALDTTYYRREVVSEDDFETYMQPFRTPGAVDALAAILKTNALKLVDTGILNDISIPALIVWGNKDRAIPKEDAQRIHQKIQNSQTVYIRQCGHTVQEEKPHELAAAVSSFLQ